MPTIVYCSLGTEQEQVFVDQLKKNHFGVVIPDQKKILKWINWQHHLAVKTISDELKTLCENFHADVLMLPLSLYGKCMGTNSSFIAKELSGHVKVVIQVDQNEEKSSEIDKVISQLCFINDEAYQASCIQKVRTLIADAQATTVSEGNVFQTNFFKKCSTE